MDTQKSIETKLQWFTGTENYYKHPMYNFNYTDGVKFLAEKAQCYWLLDEIGIANIHTKGVKEIDFQVWELKVDLNKKEAELTLKDDDNKIVLYRKIPYTDFPLPTIKLWLIDNILLLPSEY